VIEVGQCDTSLECGPRCDSSFGRLPPPSFGGSSGLGEPWPGPGAAGAAGGPAPGLVRLVTSVVLTNRDEQRVRGVRRRALRLFKSLSCAGDFLKDHRDEKGRVLRGWFVTLTYAPDVLWSPGHITGYVQKVREWCRWRGVRVRFVWVAEQHASGRVHYHAIVFLPRGLALPKPDKAGHWPHGHSQRELARKGVGYLMKYASKVREIEVPFPKGCRLHGHGGLEPAERVRRTWWVLPKYIREVVLPEWRVRRAQGGGWVSPLSGDWWPAWSGGLSIPNWGSVEYV